MQTCQESPKKKSSFNPLCFMKTPQISFTIFSISKKEKKGFFQISNKQKNLASKKNCRRIPRNKDFGGSPKQGIGTWWTSFPFLFLKNIPSFFSYHFYSNPIFMLFVYNKVYEKNNLCECFSGLLVYNAYIMNMLILQNKRTRTLSRRSSRQTTSPRPPHPLWPLTPSRPLSGPTSPPASKTDT